MKSLIVLQSLTLLVLITAVALLARSEFPSRPMAVPLPVTVPMKTVWEYKTVDCDPHKITGVPIHDDDSKTFYLDETAISDAGKDGWEMCGVYPEIETVFPTEVNAQSITEPNVRIARVVLIFKRSSQEVDETAISVQSELDQKKTP